MAIVISKFLNSIQHNTNGNNLRQGNKREISKLRKISAMEVDKMHHYIGKEVRNLGVAGC